MKRYLLWFLLLLGLSANAQILPIFEKHNALKNKTNFAVDSWYYYIAIDSADTDTIETSYAFPVIPGEDGLVEIVQVLDSLDAGASDATDDTLTINAQKGAIEFVIAGEGWIKTSWWWTIQRYYGMPFGWVTEDTLRFVKLSTRTDTVEVFSASELGTNYICVFDPTPSNVEDQWMGDVPKQTKLVWHTTSDDTARSYKLGGTINKHTPGR